MAKATGKHTIFFKLPNVGGLGVEKSPLLFFDRRFVCVYYVTCTVLWIVVAARSRFGALDEIVTLLAQSPLFRVTHIAKYQVRRVLHRKLLYFARCPSTLNCCHCVQANRNNSSCNDVTQTSGK